MSILFRLPLRLFLKPSSKLSEKRVLLVRDDVIGDLLVPSSAVVRWLCQQGYEVYLVLRKELMDIGELLLPNKQLLPVDIRLYRSSLQYRYHFLQHIRSLGFHYAIGSTIHSSVNDDIVRSSGAPERWGYKRHNKWKEHFRLRSIAKVESLPILDSSKQEYTSVVEHERHFLETAFGVHIASNAFAPALAPETLEHLERWGTFKSKGSVHGSESANDGKGVVGGNVSGDGGTAATRRLEGHLSSTSLSLPPKYIHYLAEAGAVKRVFPPARMLPLLFALSERVGMKVVVTGLKKQAISDERCINLTGQTSLPDVLDIVANASVVVGNESGLTHLAWVLGKKTALFYGGGHWGRFRPRGDVLLLNQPCEFRCCDWKCRYDSIPVPCVNLGDEEVYTLLEQFVEKMGGGYADGVGMSSW